MTRSRPLRHRAVILLLLGSAWLATACDDATDAVSAEVTVMTRNLYLGANIFRLTQANSADTLPVIAAEIFGVMEANDFPARAGARAAEIEAADPHLVGLQEVEIFRVQDPSDYVTGTTTPNATQVHTDFLQLLLDSLAARGLDYGVASQVQNADMELPAAKSASEFFDIRMTDHDVILARGDVGTSNPGSDGYDLIVKFPLPTGDTVPFQRGYTWVDATVDDVDFTFVNTHLEVSAGGQLTYWQNRQVDELLARFRDTGPIVVVGDFNSRPGENPYGLLTDVWTDAWVEVGTADSLTCCHPEVLTESRDFYSRIDLILYGGSVFGLSAEVVGVDPAGRTPSGLWPSDHAGVVSTVRVDN